MPEPTEADKVYKELRAVILSCINEGDKLTAFQIIGALEAVKMDVFDALDKHNETTKGR